MKELSPRPLSPRPQILNCNKYVDDINLQFYNLNANDELLKRYYYDNIRTNKGVMCAY